LKKVNVNAVGDYNNSVSVGVVDAFPVLRGNDRGVIEVVEHEGLVLKQAPMFHAKEPAQKKRFAINSSFQTLGESVLVVERFRNVFYMQDIFAYTSKLAVYVSGAQLFDSVVYDVLRRFVVEVSAGKGLSGKKGGSKMQKPGTP
jgi:hypothetical protein